MSRALAISACLALAACVRGNGPQAPATPAAPELRAVPVTGYGYHNETSVAVDPTRPDRVVTAFQVPATAGWSADGGRSWASAALPGTQAFDLSGDPVVFFDGDGHVYALYIAFVRPEDYDTLGKAAHRNGIFLNRSDDGGRTWRPQATAVSEQPERPGIPFEDKPMAAVDRSADPARRGHVYVAWTEFRRWETQILFARSTDGGLGFSAPIQISDRGGSPKDSVGAVEGTDVAVGPDGTVYVVWSDSTGILLDRSTDGGRTFGADTRVARTADIVFGVAGVARANGYPSIEADPRTGRLFVEWVDRRLGSAAVFLTVSTDGGRTWSEPRVVSDNAAPDGRDRFFSWMALDPKTGTLAIGYYRQEAGGLLRYVLSYSTDDGRTFRHVPWGQPFVPGGEFLGDYTGVDAYDGVVYGAWTEAAPADSTPPLHGGGHRTRVVAGRASLR